MQNKIKINDVWPDRGISKFTFLLAFKICLLLDELREIKTEKLTKQEETEM